jgi:hypothetical protein
MVHIGVIKIVIILSRSGVIADRTDTELTGNYVIRWLPVLCKMIFISGIEDTLTLLHNPLTVTTTII